MDDEIIGPEKDPYINFPFKQVHLFATSQAYAFVMAKEKTRWNELVSTFTKFVLTEP